jgi:hypothetical protein
MDYPSLTLRFSKLPILLKPNSFYRPNLKLYRQGWNSERKHTWMKMVTLKFLKAISINMMKEKDLE